MAAFMGMRGNGDWATNQRPENWRQYILYEYPNGSAPITAMMSMFKEESVNDPAFHWWTKTLPTQSGAVAGVYIDVGLSTAYVYATHQATHGISGSTIYCQVAEALAKEFRIGHTVVLRDDDRYDVDVVGKVTGVDYNGASSYVAVKLMEADDNSGTSATYNLASVDRIMIAGNMNPEGSAMPRAVAYDPTEYYNYTQIFRTPLELTNTALNTHLRTGDAYKEAKRECLELHSIELEKAAIWGIRYSGTGANGKPERGTGGLLWFTRTNASSNVDAYDLNSSYSAQDWIDGGKDWLDYYLSILFRYAQDEVIGICGDGALLGLNQLAEQHGHINLTPTSTSYGLKVITWITPFGVVHLKTHPLFSHETSTRNMIMLYKPKNVRWRPLKNRDTNFQKDQQARGVDARVEGYLTEGGFEFWHPNQFMVLEGVGSDNVV